MRLLDHLGKRARIIDVDGQVFIGVIEVVTPAIDNEEGEDSLCIDSRGVWVELFRSEIDSIEVIG